MASLRKRNRPQPIPFFREWSGPDGEKWAAIHPLYMAVTEYYMLADSRFDHRLKRISRLLGEMASGERRPLPGMIDRMLEIDREQRENGCPDERLARLAQLLAGEAQT
jgi:hypothetical protein